MKDWYCILQGRSSIRDFGWEQIYKTFVKAETKKEAVDAFHNTIEFKEKIPQRILSKNIKEDSLLLYVYEVGENHFTRDFLEERQCCICGSTYKLIDKFNEFGFYSVYECCKPSCDFMEKERRREAYCSDVENFYATYPVIYKIENIKTGKVYIGQTIRSFTLRWWEHIKSCANDKFHEAFDKSDITDWNFSVIEVINILEENIDSNGKSMKEVLTERERYWINHYNSKEDGYNSL